MSDHEITLNPHELLQASLVGVKRHIEALVKGLPDKHGFEGEGWNIHIEGAAGEMSVAKILDRYYEGSVNTFKTGGDIGSIQVRTRSRLDYDLLVRDSDRDNDIFVLAVGKAPTFIVKGWLKGSFCKLAEYRQDYGGRPSAYFVPSNKLADIMELKNTLASRAYSEMIDGKTFYNNLNSISENTEETLMELKRFAEHPGHKEADVMSKLFGK